MHKQTTWVPLQVCVCLIFGFRMAPILEVNGNGEHVDPEPGVAITTPLSSDRCSTMVPLTLEKTVAQGLGVFSPHFIPMGTLIVTERAAVVGPKPSSPAHVCLECTALLEKYF